MINTEHKLWVEKYRPTQVENYIGNESFIEDLTKWITNNDLPNLLLYGPAGTGKTTAAKLITSNINCDYLYINCSDENGIDMIRDKVKGFASAASFNPIKVVILDESDFLSINAQAALRNIIEAFSLTTRFIFTCNYVERIIDPIQSRLTSYELKAPSMREVARHLVGILDNENVKYTPDDIVSIIKKFYPDIRRVINISQSCVINSSLNIEGRLVNSSIYIDQILEELGNNSRDSFNKIRQIVANANIKDFTEIYRALFDNTSDAQDIIIIAEGLYQSTSVPDREITFMATISKLIKT